MANVLSQDEIDALREAVNSGAVPTEQAVEEEGSKGEQVKVASYDFRKPQIVASDQLHTLQMIHETLAKGIQATLLSSLKTAVEANLVALDQISYGEFVLSVANPTYLAQVGSAAGLYTFAVEVGLPIATAMTDVLLGGDENIPSESREMTSLETEIFNDIMVSILSDFDNMWASLVDTQFELQSHESNPEYTQLRTPETACMNITLDVRVANSTGVINICYPFDTIQALFAAADKRANSRRPAQGQEANTVPVLNSLGIAPLTVHAVINAGAISARDIASVSLGDVICLNHRSDRPVEVFVENHQAFTALAGEKDGKLAVSLLQPCMAPATTAAQ